MLRRKHIQRLLAKAAQDEYVLDRLLDDTNAPIAVFGFHAQQAAEKLLKAVFVARRLEYARTHRLAELMDQLRTVGVFVPAEFDDLRYLTPFAVEFRYDVVPDEDEMVMDTHVVRQALQSLRTWVEVMVSRGADEE